MIVAQIADAVASERERVHEGHASSRPLSDGYERVGVVGEFVFGAAVGQMPDLSLKPKGDKGVDFIVPLLFTVDVKCARKAGNLIHEVGKEWADIYVLVEYDDETGQGSFVGWEWGNNLRKAPSKDFGYGIKNHYIPREKLRPMGTLLGRVWRTSTP